MHTTYLEYEIEKQIEEAETIVESMVDPSIEDAADAAQIAGNKVFDRSPQQSDSTKS